MSSLILNYLGTAKSQLNNEELPFNKENNDTNDAPQFMFKQQKMFQNRSI